MTELIQVRHEGPTRILSINRASKKNALNLEMYEYLRAQLDSAASDDGIRALVLTGCDQQFTSGNDLVDFMNIDLKNPENPIVAFLHAFRLFPKPLILAVEGDAIGIGTTMLLHADLIYASATAKFALPFVKLALCPEFASSKLLPEIVGRARANEWLLLGESFGAEEALQAGLINQICHSPLDNALVSACKLGALAPSAVLQTKRLLKRGDESNVEQCIEAELQQFALQLKSDDFSNAVNAFFTARNAKK